MPLPVRPVVREILKNDVEQPVPDVTRKARAKGVTATDGALREAIYEIKSDLRRAKPKAAPAAAHATKPKTEPAAVPVLTSTDPTAVLTNVALVNAVVTAAGESSRPARWRKPFGPAGAWTPSCSTSTSSPRSAAVQRGDGGGTRWEPSRPFGPEAADLLPHLLPAARVPPQVLVQRDHISTDLDHDHAGYWIDRPFWGTGIASRAVELLLLDVADRPLFATVAPTNAASLRVLKKCGFVAEQVRHSSPTDRCPECEEAVLVPR